MLLNQNLQGVFTPKNHKKTFYFKLSTVNFLIKEGYIISLNPKNFHQSMQDLALKGHNKYKNK